MKFDIEKAEIFDRTTEKIYKASSAALSLDQTGGRIRLNIAAVDLLELRKVNKDMCVRFFRLEKHWYVAVTTEADGYAVSIETKHRGGATIGARVVLHQMLKTIGRTEYLFFETESEIQGKQVYELIPKPKN